MKTNTSKKWMVTKNNLNINVCLEYFEHFNIPIKCIIYQGEHLFIEFKDDVSYSDLKTIFPDAQLEKVMEKNKIVSDYIFDSNSKF